jgi:phospholipase C
MATYGSPMSRRSLLRAGLVTAAGAAVAGLPLPAWSQTPSAATGSGAGRRRAPDSRPDPSRPAGTPDEDMPFDHVVVLMMENRSFDHYFGMLSRRGQPRADGFSFDRSGRPTNSNPSGARRLRVFSVDGDPCAAADSGSQSWNDTHIQIDGGRMDGFARTGPGSMAYFTDITIPFYYSLAKTFTLANRWFCSAPCQTYPNRRFLMAGTAYGNISTDTSSIWTPSGGFAAPPPNGTIFDRLSQHNISWKNYFTDAPQTAIIPSVVEKYPNQVVPVAEFFADAAAGSLPAVSYVDPEFGLVQEVGGLLAPIPGLGPVGADLSYQDGDEENPADVQLGEAFVYRVIQAVMSGPAWSRTLLVWFYDEHGGWYDHVPVPAAPAPDSIPPELQAGDQPGSYSMYGPRVPAVVVSPYSRPGAVTNVVHDHTSTLATIEAKWNLPALTYRDANASTVMDFLDLRRPAFAEPPVLVPPGSVAPGEETCLQDGQRQPPPAS